MVWCMAVRGVYITGSIRKMPRKVGRVVQFGKSCANGKVFEVEGSGVRDHNERAAAAGRLQQPELAPATRLETHFLVVMGIVGFAAATTPPPSMTPPVRTVLTPPW